MVYNICRIHILIVKIQIETTKYLSEMLQSHLLGHLYQRSLFNVHNVSYKRLEDTFMPVGIFFCNWQQKNASAITKFLYVYLVTRRIRRHRKLFSLCASRICLPVLQILWLERVYFFVNWCKLTKAFFKVQNRLLCHYMTPNILA